MECRLASRLRTPGPPKGYDFLPWSEELLELHADVKWASFREEVDSLVFPCLGDRDGCTRLMREIAESTDFVPQATWLAVHYSPEGPVFCGTIQGMFGPLFVGSIQNVGIIQGHRGQGVGTGLLLRAMDGFRTMGLKHATLEVTSSNFQALKLYQALGFHHVQTVYRTVELAKDHAH
jgi:hypothetical protein